MQRRSSRPPQGPCAVLYAPDPFPEGSQHLIWSLRASAGCMGVGVEDRVKRTGKQMEGFQPPLALPSLFPP